MKLGVLQLIEPGVVSGPGHQGSVPFDPDNPSRSAGEWQGEVAYATKEVENFRGRRKFQELHRPRDQRLIDRTVDLNEIGGQKLQLHLELG